MNCLSPAEQNSAHRSGSSFTTSGLALNPHSRRVFAPTVCDAQDIAACQNVICKMSPLPAQSTFSALATTRAGSYRPQRALLHSLGLEDMSCEISPTVSLLGTGHFIIGHRTFHSGPKRSMQCRKRLRRSPHFVNL